MIPITWLITKRYKPSLIVTNFASNKKEALTAIAYMVISLTCLAIIFFAWSTSIGKPIGSSDVYTPLKILNQWIVYAALSFCPIFIILRLKLQSFESVGVTLKNWKTSLALGLVFSIVWLSIGFVFYPNSLGNFLTLNTLYAFLSFAAVGFGEELLFRGFLQTRCCRWLGDVKGLVLASVIMAFSHLPQRMFVAGFDPALAMLSVVSLIPVSLLFGAMFLRTQNIAGGSVFHTVLDVASIL